MAEGAAPLAGEITFDVPTKAVAAGETVEIAVNGKGLQSVNALSLALPYDQSKWEFVTIEPVAVKAMENLTNDRLHTNGTKALYPTFVNVGQQPDINGDVKLFVIKFKAKQRGQFKADMKDGMLIDKNLNVVNL